jgi:hypothetical protein
MNKETIKLTIFFEEPFWIGICEKVTDGHLTVARIIFGAEPKDYHVLEYVIRNWNGLVFSPPVEEYEAPKEKMNPKRMQREINKQFLTIGVGTKSQQALKLLQEQGKTERKIRRRDQKEQESERQYEIKQLKKKEKHRGR